MTKYINGILCHDYDRHIIQMATKSAMLEVAPSNTYFFTDAALDDFVIRTTTESQRVLIGTFSNATSRFSVGSNNAVIMGPLGISKLNPSPCNALDILGDTAIQGSLNVTGNVTGNVQFVAPLQTKGLLIRKQNTSNYSIGGVEGLSNDGNGILFSIPRSNNTYRFRADSNIVATLTGTGNLGIGVSRSNPTYALDVAGDINFIGTLRSNGIPFIGGGGGGPSQWSNVGSHVAIIGSNVGIGTNTPAYSLDVANNARITSNLVLPGNDSYITQFSQFSPNGTWINMSINGPSGIGNGGAGANAWIGYAHGNGNWFGNALARDICYRNTDGRLVFGTNSTAFNVAITPTALFSSNSIGIGILAPTARLHISTPNTAAGFNLLNFRNTDDFGIYAQTDSISGRGNTLRFLARDANTGSTTVRDLITMRPEGNVGIGTSNPLAPLEVASSTSPQLVLYNAAGTDTSIEFIRLNRTFGIDGAFDYRIRNSAGVMRVESGYCNLSWEVFRMGIGAGTGGNPYVTVNDSNNYGAVTIRQSAALPFSGTFNVDALGIALRATSNDIYWMMSQNVNNGLTFSRFSISNNSIGHTMHFTTDGLVGIRNSNPETTLDVVGPIKSSVAFIGNSSDTPTVPSYTWHGDSNTGMYHASAGQIGFTCLGSNVMTLSNTTLSINAPNINIVNRGLSVNGIKIGKGLPGSTPATITQTVNSVPGFTWATSNTILALSNAHSEYLFTGSNGSNLMVITATGNVGINRPAPAYTLDVQGDINFIGTLRSNGVPFVSGGGGGGTQWSNLTSNVFIIGSNIGIGLSNPSYPLHVASALSNVSIFANFDIIAYSDARVKTDLQRISSPLDKVLRLNGYTFRRNEEGATSQRQCGVIAQEVLAVLPEVVHNVGDDKYGVAYGNMVGLLIEAIKEMKADYDGKISILEKKIRILENYL
jgi:hypothetical protein